MNCASRHKLIHLHSRFTVRLFMIGSRLGKLSHQNFFDKSSTIKLISQNARQSYSLRCLTSDQAMLKQVPSIVNNGVFERISSQHGMIQLLMQGYIMPLCPSTDHFSSNHQSFSLQAGCSLLFIITSFVSTFAQNIQSFQALIAITIVKQI